MEGGLRDLPAAALGYEEAFRGNQDLHEALYRLAGCLSRSGTPAAIRQRLKSCLEAGNPEHAMLLADVLAVHGRYRESLQAVRALEQQTGVTQETAFFRGYALFMLRRFEAARIAWERLGPASTLHSQGLLWQIHAAWAEDDWPEATRLLRRLARSPVPSLEKRLYREVHRLFVDGGGFSTLSSRRAESAALGRSLLTLLHAFWSVRRNDLASRLLLFLPLINWPEGYREAGLLALRCALGPGPPPDQAPETALAAHPPPRHARALRPGVCGTAAAGSGHEKRMSSAGVQSPPTHNSRWGERYSARNNRGSSTRRPSSGNW